MAALALDPFQEPVAGDDAEDAMWLDIEMVSELEGEDMLPTTVLNLIWYLQNCIIFGTLIGMLHYPIT